MLTALAVVHWNENRLPEQRAELYESVLTWLFRSREEKERRVKADRCRKLLQKLALAMFTHPKGRQRQVCLRWAAERLAGEFKAEAVYNQIEEAENFLHAEMMDSGVIVERELRVEFWHSIFQEYLVAYEIGGYTEGALLEILFCNQRLYLPEWREVIIFLGGVLYKQGEDRINSFIDAIIENGPKITSKETLPELAKEVGILGAIVRDLAPYGFQPANADYPDVVRSITSIFNKDTFRDVPIKLRIETADILGQVGDPRLDSNPMVFIDEGQFWMGAQNISIDERHYDKDAEQDESPVHLIELSSFYISKYPITVTQYLRFVEDEGYENEIYWKNGGFGGYKEPDKWDEQLSFPSRPVVCISWYEASAYASWSGGRLPTEAQWERAARGLDKNYKKFIWGNKQPDENTTNFIHSRVGHITPVGIFPENMSLEGVIDLAGNVWEWCMDWYNKDYYQSCSEGILNPVGSSNGNARVIRGGAFFSSQKVLRCSVRNGNDPNIRDDYIGFRIVTG